MREIEVKGIYRHFKGNLYIVEDIGIDCETERECVIYRALYGDKELWIRDKEMFLSEVDHEKYPNAEQKYRFELIEIKQRSNL